MTQHLGFLKQPYFYNSCKTDFAFLSAELTGILVLNI